MNKEKCQVWELSGFYIKGCRKFHKFSLLMGDFTREKIIADYKKKGIFITNISLYRDFSNTEPNEAIEELLDNYDY